MCLKGPRRRKEGAVNDDFLKCDDISFCFVEVSVFFQTNISEKLGVRV